jgi:hypothetical protein
MHKQLKTKGFVFESVEEGLDRFTGLLARFVDRQHIGRADGCPHLFAVRIERLLNRCADQKNPCSSSDSHSG